MRYYSSQDGFTLIEMLLTSFFLSMLFLFGSDNLTITNKARESEVIANLHKIQVAIERYETDNNRYPSFLLGGDGKGWRLWHLANDEAEPPVDEPSNNLVQDVLIQYGYLVSYPENPFVDDGMTIIRSTCWRGSGPGGDFRGGDGDPRFGFYGNKMGNGLDDPNFFWQKKSGYRSTRTSLVETHRTLSDETVKKCGFVEPPAGLHYMMGGRRAQDDKGNIITVAAFWPGNFFYRGLCEYWPERKGWSKLDPGVAPYGAFMHRYILGGYGALSTSGYDVIRLECRNWDNTDDVFFRFPPPTYKYARNSGSKCSYGINDRGLPAVCGGGDANRGPFFPPDRGDITEGYTQGQYIYGAPDGHPDGIIAVLIPGDGLETW